MSSLLGLIHIFKSSLCVKGTVAVVSLLTGSVVARFYGDGNGLSSLGGNATMGNMTLDYEDMDSPSPIPADVKIGIVMTLALLVGITQVR